MSAQLALALDLTPKRQRVPAHARGSATSRDAAFRAIPKITAAHRHILGVVRMAGPNGATRPEICAALGMLTQTACARLNELERMRLLFRPDARERDPKDGATVLVPWTRDRCSVYVITGKGRAL